MAYTISFIDGKEEMQLKVLSYLEARMCKEGIFRAKLTPFSDKGIFCIKIKPVRLIKPKEYCGNHPGECQVSFRKKPKATYLEWSDWIKFHGLVNRVLNRFKANANVWSTPADVKGKMWIRRGKKPRIKYDWTEEYNPRFGRNIQIWNKGDESQF